MRSRSRVVLGARRPAAAGTAALAPAPAEIVDVRTEPPVVARHAGGRVLLGASAAGPLGGDHFTLDLDIEPGAAADVGTVGATMILPSRAPARSSTTTSISIGADASLRWYPEPTISVAGSTHESLLHVRLASTATCRLVDELALGRSGERAGVFASTVRVERGGAPLVHHAETFGPGRPGGGSLAAAPESGHVITSVVVGPEASPRPAADVGANHWAAILPLGADAHLTVVIAVDRPTALALFRQLDESVMV